MAPVPGKHAEIRALPSNTAQLGMGWEIITSTIDLGLGIFDLIVMIGEWVHEYSKKRTAEAKAALMLEKGKKPKQPRSLKFLEEDPTMESNWI